MTCDELLVKAVEYYYKITMWLQMNQKLFHMFLNLVGRFYT
jgi:hypothetical protein